MFAMSIFSEWFPEVQLRRLYDIFNLIKKSLKLKFHLFLYNICIVFQKMCFVLYLWVIFSVLTVELSVLFLQKVAWFATDDWRSESRQKWSRNFWRYTTGLQDLWSWTHSSRTSTGTGFSASKIAALAVFVATRLCSGAVCSRPTTASAFLTEHKDVALRRCSKEEWRLSAKGISVGDGGKEDTTTCQIFTE